MCALAAASLLSAAACSPAAPRERIVLITLDTLRYDGFAGGPGIADAMPHTRALADRGRVFHRSYAATSTTQPTHASLFTGLHPWQHGVERNGIVLADELETVTERLRGRGFATAAVVASFPVHRGFGFAQGFDHYDDTFTTGDRARWNEVEVPGERFYSKADRVTDRGIELLDTLGGERQFLWLHYFDAHQPYGDAPGADPITLISIKNALRDGEPGARAQIERARERYLHDVRFLDAMLGRLYERLDADTDTTTTHIVIVSDHGEAFGEARALGHGEGVTSEQIRVPLIVVSPRVSPGESDLPVGSVDVAATLDALGGAGAATEAPRAGLDLTGDPATWPADRPVVGMRRTFAKPFENVRADGSVETVDYRRFYLVAEGRELAGNDTQVEANDGAPVDSALAARARALFATFEAELDGNERAELLDEDTQRALEALGYKR